MDNMQQENSESKTLILWILSLIVSMYWISPVWWFQKLWHKLGIERTNLIYQNTTDIFVVLRLIFSLLLVLSNNQSFFARLATILLLLELTVAYFAHFFSDKFNAAGPGKVTSAKRTIAIMSVNFISYIFLFASLLVYVERLQPIQSIYLSTVTITTLGYGDITPKTNLGKLLVSCEALIGIFQLAIVFGTIVGWSRYRERISP
ncbi:MAG: two pore domain potassium channel family protein [Nitrospirae bacterium]|nr:two pore domain potassium channel family protein [Nitrospirota bacterium]